MLRIALLRWFKWLLTTYPLKKRQLRLNHLQYDYVWSYENNFLDTPEGGWNNSLPTECHLLITSANSLDPDQARQNVGPVLDQNCSTLRWYSWNIFFEKVDFEKKISRRQKSLKIAIRGDGKSPDQKVIDMQLQAANLVYIFDVIILSVTANKSGRLTVETSFLPLNSVFTLYICLPKIIKISQRVLKLLSAQASSYKVHSREITYKSSKGEQQFLNARHPLDLLYIYTIYYQNISKDIKVIERTSFPL